MQYVAAPGRVTFACLAGKDRRYWIVIFAREFVTEPLEKLKEASLEWPQAFAYLNIPSQVLVETLGFNHPHTVAGDYVGSLAEFCSIVSIEAKILGG